MFLFYLYLYLVILISLAVSYAALAFGLNAGLDLALGVSTTLNTRRTLANAVGLFLVAAPLWLAHWVWLRRTLPDLANPGAMLLSWVHRLYIYGVLGFTVLAVLGWGGAAVATLVGVPIGAQESGPQAVARFGTRFGLLFLSCLLWVFHWQELTGVLTQTTSPSGPGEPPA